MTPLAVRATGQGPNLMMVHGWGLHSGVFDPVVPRLASRFTILRVDLPGHGASAGHDDFPPLDDLADMLDRQLPAGHWLGWSLGGMAILALAVRHPAKVQSLVLTATAACWTTGPGRTWGMPLANFQQFRQDLRDDQRATLRRFLSLVVRGGEAAAEDLRQLRSIARQYPRPSSRVLESGLEILGNADLREALPGIRVPALLLRGCADALVRPDAMEYLAAALPAAQSVAIPGAGHAPFISHPDAFCEAAFEFLQPEAAHV